MNSAVIKCEICYERYHPHIPGKKPRMLPCGHTYCTDCLNKLLVSERITCPEDRKEFQLNKVDTLPINYSVVKLLDSVCATCENEIKENACLCDHCHKRICDYCRPKHFDEFKTAIQADLSSLRAQLVVYDSNASDLATFITTDLQSTEVYMKRTLPKIKDNNKRNEIEQLVMKFYTDHDIILKRINQDQVLIKENLAKNQEILSAVEQLASDTASIRQLNAYNESLRKLAAYKPSDINKDVSISKNKYEVANPIIENRYETDYLT